MTPEEADMHAVMVVIGLFNDALDLNVAAFALNGCNRLAAGGTGWLEKLFIAKSEMKQNGMGPKLDSFMFLISGMTSDKTKAALALSISKGLLDGGPKPN